MHIAVVVGSLPIILLHLPRVTPTTQNVSAGDRRAAPAAAAKAVTPDLRANSRTRARQRPTCTTAGSRLLTLALVRSSDARCSCVTTLYATESRPLPLPASGRTPTPRTDLAHPAANHMSFITLFFFFVSQRFNRKGASSSGSARVPRDGGSRSRDSEQRWTCWNWALPCETSLGSSWSCGRAARISSSLRSHRGFPCSPSPLCRWRGAVRTGEREVVVARWRGSLQKRVLRCLL